MYMCVTIFRNVSVEFLNYAGCTLQTHACIQVNKLRLIFDFLMPVRPQTVLFRLASYLLHTCFQQIPARLATVARFTDTTAVGSDWGAYSHEPRSLTATASFASLKPRSGTSSCLITAYRVYISANEGTVSS